MMKASLVAFLQLIPLWMSFSGTSYSIASPYPLVEWLRTKPNGFFSDKISWKPLDPTDPSSSYAMFATEDIPKDERLIVVPQSALITSNGTGSSCNTVKMLLEELEKGENSEYYPYINYLFGDDSKRGRVPTAWSEEGKYLLEIVIGDSLFPSSIDHHKIESYCPEEFGKNPTEEAQDAYLFMISRSWNDVMIPVYDMINHRNGKWRNVEATSAHVGEDIKVFAYRDIVAGEQLYMSYSECEDEDCKVGMKYKYITPGILSDYGFVEQYPRRFFLEEERKLVAEVDIDDKDGQKFLTWPLGKLPSFDQVNYMAAQLKRLNNMIADLAYSIAELESDHERDVIAEWHRAYREALELAVAYRRGGRSPAGNTATKMYDPLTEGKGPGVEGLNVEVCWDNPSDRDYDSHDLTESQYQEIEFTYNEDKDNTCLHLSGWLQTCTNFRPHYHEAFVHVPAQYVDDVKRVAFLGGGDNMILHEILKYPNLELVVGMELDQQVIRSAFRNLATLPYFDDSRVHWWFGDATKSLFALPESYFGSFDLVLVDLQTFVADALKVTDRLTIMDTAILLMKQDGGVIAKNEDFNVRTNVGFAKYTVDLEYHDLPQICQQSITMGSNSIDFVTAKTKAHDIETLAIDLPADEDADPFHAWYSYRQTVRDTCSATYEKNTGSKDDVSSAKPKDQLGILVILEAENLTRPLTSTTEVKEVISESIKKLDLTEVKTSVASDEASSFFIMKEGVITARVFAEEKYIAFDVLLWDSLDLVDALNEELINAFGGNLQESTTSFRFVTGGMAGLDSCQKDVLTEIASQTEALLCKNTEPSVAFTSADSGYDNAMSSILRDLVTVFMPRHDDDSSVIGILCGDETSVCSSLQTIQEIDTLPLEVVPIYACDSFDEMNLCEKELEQKLQGIVTKNKKLDALVMDTSLPFSMGQIIESLFSNPIIHNKFMERIHLVLTPVLEEERWRNVLIDRFRTDVVLFDGAHRADLRFSKLDSGKKKSSLEWSIFSAFDDEFFHQLSSALSLIKESTGLEPEVTEVANGIVNYVADFAPPNEFTDSDYDNSRSIAQWNSQTPVGHQTIFQMNVQPPKMQLDIGERVLAEYQPGPWDMVYGGAIVEEYLGDEIYSVIYDGDSESETITRDQIRKFSGMDIDLSTSFEVGDLIFYNNIKDLAHQNGVISRVDKDGTYSIYLLNPSGQKLYGVKRDELMYQFETADFYQDIPDLSIPTLCDAFEKALRTESVGAEKLTIHESIPIGTGVLVTAFWNEGHAILKWDGMKRVDINMFTYEEDMEMRLDFQDAFCDEIDYMKSIARDEHPRGYGSIVNFESETENPPHWIEDDESD